MAKGVGGAVYGNGPCQEITPVNLHFLLASKTLVWDAWFIGIILPR